MSVIIRSTLKIKWKFEKDMSETKYPVSITHACKYDKNNIHNCTKQNIYYNEYKIANCNEHKCN